jgi:two-component system, sensor histidine kinase and response regulator
MPKLKILVIDDEPGIRSGISRILKNFRVDYPFMDEAFAFEVFEASTGEEGIELLEEKLPDIILLDNKLPGIQGVEVLEYVRKKQLSIVVVMITSYASLELAVKATTDGAYDFIPKPFTPQELKSSIENITKRVFLTKMAQTLKDTGREVRFQFLSVLSHELKSPLNAIEGYLKMAKDRQLGDKLEDYDQAFDRSLERIRGMRNLILDLLDLTKASSSKSKKEPVRINLGEAAALAIDAIRPYAIQRDIRVTLHEPHDLYLCGDPDEIEIIFNNLLSNAIKYNKDGGSVDCTLEKSPEQVTIKVMDTGIGMSEEDMKKLFQDFVRIKNEKTKNISGSGLGLSIVKKLTEKYKGKIEVSSFPDQGSTFVVTLPNAEPCT